MARHLETDSVQLYDVEKQSFVDAELRNTISRENVKDWEYLWLPEQVRIFNAFLDRGRAIANLKESFHWNWSKKVYDLQTNQNQQGFALTCEGKTQALMIVDLNRKSRLPNQNGRPLVYVDFVQSAPWNMSEEYGRTNKYRKCGTIMLRKAARFSASLGWKGLIGLHSLSSSIGFYKRKMSMTSLGLDNEYQNLTYFETTVEQAQEILRQGD